MWSVAKSRSVPYIVHRLLTSRVELPAKLDHCLANGAKDERPTHRGKSASFGLRD